MNTAATKGLSKFRQASFGRIYTKQEAARRAAAERAAALATAQEAKPPSRAKPGPKPMPVMVRGVIYESVAACAAHFGIKDGTVRSMIERGREDMIGLGMGGPRVYGKDNPRSKAVTVGGETFDCIADLARRIGINRRRACRMVAAGRWAELERMMETATAGKEEGDA